MTIVADLIVEQLQVQGVEWVSTLCGNGTDPFYRACCRWGLDVIDTHNEQAAAYMADGYARLTGKLGVCVVSSGIAHVNALTGIANAHFDHAPVLLITGASSGYGGHRGDFQEFDQVGLADPICQYSSCIRRPQDAFSQLSRAIFLALSEPPGPVHLTIPLEVFRSEVKYASPPEPVEKAQSSTPTEDSILRLREMIMNSSKPFLVLGTGCLRSDYRKSIIAFSEKLSVPMGVPIWDRGCIQSDHPNFMGVLGAASGEPGLLEDSDLVIMAGAEVDYRVGYLSPPKVKKEVTRISVNWSPTFCETGFEMNITGDPGQILGRLSKGGQPGVRKEWMKVCRSRLDGFRKPWNIRFEGTGVQTGGDLVEVLRPLLDGDRLFLIDGGNIGQWAHMVLANRYPSSWLTCGASAVVGWGIPGAMAAKKAHPERDVLLLSGDGAFGFTPSELESAVRQNLPFVAVVANDSAWGIVVCGQRQSWEKGTMACETGEIRYDEVARGFGANGLRLSGKTEIRKAIKSGFERDVPTVIDVPIKVESPSDQR